MVPGRVSVIVPARNETFLAPTVRDLLTRAHGDVEVIVLLDGYWPDPALEDDPRLRIVHRGDAVGMRPNINAAAQIATGEFLLKSDAHCLWADGYDDALKAHYHERNWVLVPRRYALNPDTWAIDPSNRKYPVDAHYLSYPWEREDDPTCGMHGTPWSARRDARRDVLLDDEMSSQGSAWFMHREHFAQRVGPLRIDLYGNFVQEFQEIGNTTWAGGGAVKVLKSTHYAHLYKGKKHGRGYSMGQTNHQQGVAYCIDHWMGARAESTRRLVERFWPVPGWPADLDEAFRYRQGLAARRFARSTSDRVPA